VGVFLCIALFDLKADFITKSPPLTNIFMHVII
jgi:hypothetical protein